MRTMRIGAHVSVLCLVLACSVAPQAESEQGEASTGAEAQLAAMGWLAGTWRGPAPKGTWEARYSSAEGGLILSLNKQVVEGRTVAFEFEHFSVRDSAVVMQPFPSGTKSDVFFTLTEWDAGARRALFENPEHDFPQKLTYHRVSDDTLRVRAEAVHEGRSRGFELILTLQD